MHELRAAIATELHSLTPLDDLEREHQRDALAWLADDADIFRRAKPDIPAKHLVSYFLLMDIERRSCLLVDHKLAGLWLPTGGHIEPGEHPAQTVEREALEELGVSADFHGPRSPLFVSQAETTGPGRHTDVSLWYLLRGREGAHFDPDAEEFHEVRWWPLEELRVAPPHLFDPHLHRFLRKAGSRLALLRP